MDAWGRPDMAYFKFTKNILENLPIEVFNHGKMKRDFTYVEDISEAIYLLIDHSPSKIEYKDRLLGDSISAVAPFRIINIGNSEPVSLSDFIGAIENATGNEAKKKMMPMHKVM